MNQKLVDSDARSRSEEAEKIVRWISPLSFHATHASILESVEPGTGTWLPNHETFRNWVRSGIDALWCPGIREAIRLSQVFPIQTLIHLC